MCCRRMILAVFIVFVALPSWAANTRLDLNTKAIKAGGVYWATTELEVVNAQSNSAITQVVNAAPWTMTASRTLTKPLRCEAGAIITTTGYTLTLSGGFEAGNYTAFSGTGTVVLPATLSEAQALWWGTTQTALQAAINASAEAGVRLYVGGSDMTWTITSTLTAPSNSHIYGSATINATTNTGGRAIDVLGSLSASSSNCSGNVSEGDFSTTVANGALFSVDEWVLLHSADTDIIASATYRSRGEFKRIRAIDGNVVSFTTPALENYTTANTARVTKVNWVENITIDGLTIVGKNSELANDYGVRLLYAKNARVMNCTFRDIEIHSLSFEMCLDFEAYSNRFDGVQYLTTADGNSFYAIVVTDCSMHGRIHHNVGEKIRHLVTTTAYSVSSGHFGQPYFLTIDHNHMRDAMGGTSKVSYAYEQHGSGRFTVWDSNVADGCYSGMHIDNGRDTKIVNNTLVNCSVAGISFGDTWSTEFVNLDISGNSIYKHNYDGVVDSDHIPHGIRYMGPYENVTWKNVVIANNKIDKFNAAGSIGIYMEVSLDSKSGCRITGNTITGGEMTQDADSSFGIYMHDSVDWLIDGNMVSNMLSGIYSDCNGVEGKPNVIMNNTVEWSIQNNNLGYGIEIKGDKTVVKNNIVRRARYPLYIVAGATGVLVVDNVWYGCLYSIKEEGTSTVLRDNDTL